MSDIWVVYSTFPSRAEALSVARELVQRHLIACANILENVTSVYRWEDELKEEGEVVLMGKTIASRVDETVTCIRMLHSYDTPCITAWPVGKGSVPFLEWVAKETKA